MRAGLRAAPGEEGAGGAQRGSGCRGDRQELTRLLFPFSSSANSQPLPASPLRCRERERERERKRERKSLAPGFPSPPPSPALSKKQKRKIKNTGRGGSGEPPGAPTFSAKQRTSPAARYPGAPRGRAVRRGKALFIPAQGRTPPTGAQVAGTAGRSLPPTFCGAAPRPSRPAAGPGERLRAAGQHPAGRRGPAAAGAWMRVRLGGEGAGGSRPHTGSVRPAPSTGPPGRPPPPAPFTRRGGAGAVSRGQRGAGSGAVRVARRRGAAVRRWCCGPRHPAARP